MAVFFSESVNSMGDFLELVQKSPIGLHFDLSTEFSSFIYNISLFIDYGIEWDVSYGS